jgi:integrase
VHLRRSGRYWLARWSGGSKGLGKREDAGGLVSREFALMACAKLEKDMAEGKRAAVMPTISRWTEAFLSLRPGRAEATDQLYRACGERLGRFLGPDTLLSAVTPLDAAKFIAWLTTAEGLAAGSVKRILRKAKTLFAEAAALEIIPCSPLRVVKAPAAQIDRSWASVPLPTLERLLDVAVGPFRGFLALCRLAGLRVNEALRLKWQDVDLVGRRLTVVNPGRYGSTKHRTRTVPIVPRLHDVLFGLSMEANGGELVCEGVRDPDRGFVTLCAKAHVEPWAAPFQAMRKARESELAAEFPLHVCCDFLGNSPTVALRHYLKAKDEDFTRAAAPPQSEAAAVK